MGRAETCHFLAFFLSQMGKVLRTSTPSIGTRRDDVPPSPSQDAFHRLLRPPRHTQTVTRWLCGASFTVDPPTCTANNNILNPQPQSPPKFTLMLGTERIHDEKGSLDDLMAVGYR